MSIYKKEVNPREWAGAQRNLGLTLSSKVLKLGKSSSIELAREAVDTLRESLDVYCPEDFPSEWATAQSSLGIALSVLSNKCDRATAIDLLNEAVAAYRAGLEVLRKDEVPLKWAISTENLGQVLHEIADLDTPHRCEHLLSAREALSSVLELYKPDDMPVVRRNVTNHLAQIERKLTRFC